MRQENRNADVVFGTVTRIQEAEPFGKQGDQYPPTNDSRSPRLQEHPPELKS
jgi:hypothetical protein